MGPGELGPGWGSVDYQDLMAVVDEAVKRFDFCDPERMGVLGGSYGGYMTSWIVGHNNRFKAACSERAVNNMVSMYGSSDIGWVFKGYHGEFVHDAVDKYLGFSPWTYAKEIETPLLILHSEQDLRCNIEQAEQLFTTLRLLKKEVELVRFPAESHELTRSGNPGAPGPALRARARVVRPLPEVVRQECGRPHPRTPARRRRATLAGCEAAAMNRATAATTLRHRRPTPLLGPSVRGTVAYPSLRRL